MILLKDGTLFAVKRWEFYMSLTRKVNLTVDDVQRIKEYAWLGLQIEQDIPDDVFAAYERLVELGYDKYLLKA